MKLRPFELGLVVVFAVMMIGALIMIKIWEPPAKEMSLLEKAGKVNIWGTIPKQSFDAALSTLIEQDRAYSLIEYRYVSPENFSSVLVNALADRQGPDLILASQEMLIEMRSRIQPFSTDEKEGFPLRDFQDRYLDGAKIFILSDGLYAYPMAVDPLMMYWNRRILTANGMFDPPRTWESLVNEYVPNLTQKNADRTLKLSTVAMGEYKNIHNAFGIISALLIQGGTAGVVEGLRDNEYRIQLNTPIVGKGEPFTAAVNFYTRFSKSSDSLYSWNRALGEDRDLFVGEKLVFYFGYGSEGRQLEKMNPNFEFDIASIPQGENASIDRTYARFYGLSLLKNAPNQAGAMAVLGVLASRNVADVIAGAAGMVSPYRETVKQGSNDFYGRVSYRSAPVALTWLSPGPQKSDEIFTIMVEDVSGNRSSVKDAVRDAERRLVGAY